MKIAITTIRRFDDSHETEFISYCMVSGALTTAQAQQLQETGRVIINTSQPGEGAARTVWTMKRSGEDDEQGTD